MVIEVISHKQAAMRYIFDNGNDVSIIFGPYTYSDNHDLSPFREAFEVLRAEKVEIMVDGKAAFVKWFERKYGDNPGGYIPVADIPAILKIADSRVYQ